MSRNSGEYYGAGNAGFLTIHHVTNSFIYELTDLVTSVLILISLTFHSQEIIYVDLPKRGRKYMRYSPVFIFCTVSWDYLYVFSLIKYIIKQMKSTLSVLDKWEKKKKDVTEIISDKVDIKLVMS